MARTGVASKLENFRGRLLAGKNSALITKNYSIFKVTHLFQINILCEGVSRKKFNIRSFFSKILGLVVADIKCHRGGFLICFTVEGDGSTQDIKLLLKDETSNVGRITGCW